jgi:hypothetical protein
VKSARYRVPTIAKLSTSVENGKNNLKSWPFFDGVEIDRDSTAVINNFDSAGGGHGYVYLGAVAGQGFIDRVIYNLIDEMVEAALTG